ncbi:uncharacterized protein LAESUDRAFT_160608 [Laetiporus sulphureus 93-53]|uniref:YEATS domain-containing protein n=1 Tax=Laetiporus sulphureus 93-53 TaxID=1314785 RepID=A0A165HNB6_9APHY|nr:uncharacterized protein LAESUDRAFT_160608 [Laetiporus sulphureus 93-53]KZT11963.1 hypothetical protein LAESUDRAFT_160608 [Laetiporus sulphureus 93-53]
MYQQLVLEEVDLELGLRERLYETVHSRLTWALILQETLEKGLKGATSEEAPFQEAALDALHAIEHPCSILFDRETKLPDRPIPLPVTPADYAVPEATSVSSHSTPRIGSTRLRGLPRAPPPPSKKLLFLRNATTSPPEIAKLVCSDCLRSDFSNLQGLLNHCRLRHHREFGSHDECIQRCAVLVPDEERDWVVANGTELGGISLPSLRRLFEIAVGAGEHISFSNLHHHPSRENNNEANAVIHSKKKETPVPTSTEVTRTLGHHMDTPALAPFLGRAPKRRIIHVYDDLNEVIDIVGETEESIGGGKNRAWRMHYNHRNVARPAIDEVNPLTEVEKKTEPQENSLMSGAANTCSLSNAASSRFHVNARVKIADYSLWLHPDRRVKSHPDHTHRWRLAVSAPSYSLHISTFLAKLTITCLTDPPPSTLIKPIVVTEPPFVVTRTTDKPFLACINLTWIGAMNPPMDVEHWVDIDPIHLGNPVLGDEQVFDVELDKTTPLLPVREDARKVTWRDEQSGMDKHDKSTEEHTNTDPEYILTLRALLPQVPIMTKDWKGRHHEQSVSMLVPGAAQFRNIVPGRRKAIEMSRARALRHAYEKHVASLPDTDNLIPLTAVEVYRWMEDENIFPRAALEKAAATASSSQDELAQHLDEYCPFCGLIQPLHPAVVKDDGGDNVKPAEIFSFTRGSSNWAVCTTFNAPTPRLPLLVLNHLMGKISDAGPAEPLSYELHPTIYSVPYPSTQGPGVAMSSSDLPAFVDPALVYAIRNVSAMWRLKHFAAASQLFSDSANDLSGRTGVNRPRQELLDDLAPYALLAAVTRSMVKLLVHDGVSAFRRDEAALRALGPDDRPAKRRAQTTPAIRRLLTPSHIARGLELNAGRGLVGSAALLSLALLGATGVDTGSGVIPSARAILGSNVTVKMEEGDHMRC